MVRRPCLQAYVLCTLQRMWHLITIFLRRVLARPRTSYLHRQGTVRVSSAQLGLLWTRSLTRMHSRRCSGLSYVHR